MMPARSLLRATLFLSLVLGFGWACGFDDTLREYLSAQFWLPLAKSAAHLDKGKKDDRLSAPFAGMTKSNGTSPLEKLRAAYRAIPGPEAAPADPVKLHQLLAAARSAPNLSTQDREEVALLDAKIDIRTAPEASPATLGPAKSKLKAFLQQAHSPEFLSEARGWLAHIHYLLGEQSAAGKIYLDELGRTDSNLSRETLYSSLQLTYGYDGGPELVEHLDEYFDTPAHAAFAIQLATNPHWTRRNPREGLEPEPDEAAPPPYDRIKTALDQHRDLFRTEPGAGLLAALGMRNALRAADPAAALRIAGAVPRNAPVRSDPDFHWMLGSARFLLHDYAGAIPPLLLLTRARAAAYEQQSAAAYGLCGVYQKLHQPVEQIRWALWLDARNRSDDRHLLSPSVIENYSVYWASSGWDLSLLLDTEAPIDALRGFLARYPQLAGVNLVRYSLAVRLARDNRYLEAAQLYDNVNARHRAARMRELAVLYADAVSTPPQSQAKYRLAEFIAAHPDGLYFNDRLWGGLQRYALHADVDGRLTRTERVRLMAGERKLKDEQEERWRAYLLLQEVVQESDDLDLSRRAAGLALRCLRQISERFGREKEIRAADINLSAWLRRHASAARDVTRP